ncbi:peptidoglycan-associated lipoprotein Pal [Aurantivibrio infirmus]
MVTNSLKQLLALACVLALVAGCSSSDTVDEPVVDTTVEEPVTVGSGNDNGLSSEEMEAPDLATVFYFDFDQSIIKPESRAALTGHAQFYRNNSQGIRLEGHADERGSREYNIALGERRANAVRDFLVLQGIDRSRIETVSYGEERPAALGSGENAWAQNRRVELK